jgi:hypothetical protein
MNLSYFSRHNSHQSPEILRYHQVENKNLNLKTFGGVFFSKKKKNRIMRDPSKWDYHDPAGEAGRSRATHEAGANGESPTEAERKKRRKKEHRMQKGKKKKGRDHRQIVRSSVRQTKVTTRPLRVYAPLQRVSGLFCIRSISICNLCFFILFAG